MEKTTISFYKLSKKLMKKVIGWLFPTIDSRIWTIGWKIESLHYKKN